MKIDAPIKYRVASSGSTYHLCKKDGTSLCGEHVSYSPQFHPWPNGFLQHSRMSAAMYCEECGIRDANNGLPSVPPEDITYRETTSERTRNTEWVEVTRYGATGGNTYSLGYSGGDRYWLTERQYNQLDSSSIERIRQAINTEAAQRSRSARSALFRAAVAVEIARISQDETRVQRQRPYRHLGIITRADTNYNYTDPYWRS